MTIEDNFCRTCSENLESYVEFGNLSDFTEIHKINLPLTSTSKICLVCFDFLNKFQKFCSIAQRVPSFLTFIANLQDPTDDFNIKSARDLHGLISRCDKSTDTNEYFEVTEHSIDEIEQIEDVVTDEEVQLVENQTKENLKFEELDYTCHVCNEEFKNFFSLLAHTRKQHDSLPMVYCPCGATLSSRAQIQQHKKIHTTTKFSTCQICEKVYTHEQSLQNHMKKCHNEEKKNFECLKCCKILDSERKLKIHEQTHLPDDKKLIYPCPIVGCEKKFSKSVNVHAHVKAIHSKSRPFICNDCGKSFSTKGALKEHTIVHSNAFPYACSFCDKKFKNIPRLKTHEDTHGVTQYICNICGISLNTKRTLKQHMLVHSEEKRFKCEFCGSSFKRSKALKNHLILHSGLRPYSCPFCDKTFANGSNCRSHKKKAHPKELAAFEAAGKATTTPNIPRLDQLMPKNQQDMLAVDNTCVIIQEIISESVTNPTIIVKN